MVQERVQTLYVRGCRHGGLEGADMVRERVQTWRVRGCRHGR